MKDRASYVAIDSCYSCFFTYSPFLYPSYRGSGLYSAYCRGVHHHIRVVCLIMAPTDSEVRRSHKVPGDSSKTELAVVPRPQRRTSRGRQPARRPSRSPASPDASGPSAPKSTTHCRAREARGDAQVSRPSRDSFDSITDDPFFRRYHPPDRSDRADEDRRPSNSTTGLVPRNDTSTSRPKLARYQESLISSELYDLVRAARPDKTKKSRECGLIDPSLVW